MKSNKTTILILALIWNLSLAGSALGALTAKTSIVDPLRVAYNSSNTGGPTNNGQAPVDMPASANETPVRANSTYFTSGGAASGFKWGGYYSSTETGTNQGIRILDNNVSNTGVLISNTFLGGQYWYTIFDSNGGNAPNQYVNLGGKQASFSVYLNASANHANAIFSLRVMLRSNSGAQWYISEPKTVPLITTTAVRNMFPLYVMKWYAVDGSGNTNLNALAAADEAALTFGTTEVTPDFSKVDGGGVYIDNVTGSDSQVGHLNPGNKSIKINRPTWTAVDAQALSALTAVCAPTYPKSTTCLVLTPGVAQSGTITVGVKNGIPVTITGASLAGGSASEFTLSGLPSFPVTLSGSANFTANIGWTPSTPDNKESSASLRLICDASYAPGTAVDIPIKGRDLVSASIYESFADSNTADYMARATSFSNYEKAATMESPTGGKGYTGFIWGGYTTATDRAVPTEAPDGRDWVGFVGRLCFPGTVAADNTYSGCWHGCYAYGMFDTMAGTAAIPNALYIDRSVNLHKIQFYNAAVPVGCKVRWLIRDGLAHWFLSKDVTNISTFPASTFNTLDIENFSQGWLRVDTTGEAYMENIVAARTANIVVKTPIADPSALVVGTPDGINTAAFKVTGVGVYIEQGNTDPSATLLEFQDLNLIAQPTNGDTLTTSKTTVNEPIPVPNRRLALAGITLNVTAGVESALDGVDVTVSPNTSGLQSLILMDDPNGNGRPDAGEAELTSCTLDANGSTAHLTFKATQILNFGAQQKMSLAGVFNDTASSKTYTASIPVTGWKQNVDSGGTDTIVSLPNPITASIGVGSLTFPAVDTLYENQSLKETWNGVAAATIPTSAASGTISGADNSWSWAWLFHDGQTPSWTAGFNYSNAQFALRNSSMALGVEVKDMTVEPQYQHGIWFNTATPFLLNFNWDNTRVVKLGFDLTITSTCLSASAGHLTGRAINEKSNFLLRLGALDNADAYNFTVYPLLDVGRYLFGVNVVAGGVTYMSQYAPRNIRDYGPAPAYTGLYKFVLWLAPYSIDTATIAKVEMIQVETGKKLTWVTVIDGKVPDLKNLRLDYDSYPDFFIDNIVLTSYSYLLNPVKHWSIFE